MQSPTLINVLEELMTKTDDDLQNCIGIPDIVTRNGIDQIRHRMNTYQWLASQPLQDLDGTTKRVGEECKSLIKSK
jgi:hypothetical protein